MAEFRPNTPSFRSQAQERYLSGTEPYVAGKFTSATPPWKPLPDRLNSPAPVSPEEELKRRYAMERNLNAV